MDQFLDSLLKEPQGVCCANCEQSETLVMTHYTHGVAGVDKLCATIFLCKVCRRALEDGELIADLKGEVQRGARHVVLFTA